MQLRQLADATLPGCAGGLVLSEGDGGAQELVAEECAHVGLIRRGPEAQWQHRLLRDLVHGCVPLR